MNGKRRLAVFGGASAIASLMSGCLTRSLYQGTNYTEEVSAVFISQDGKKLVFIGHDYHYIFDAPDIVVSTLRASFHPSVSARLDNFHVDGEGVTTGKFSLTLDMKTPEEDRLAAIAAGYRKMPVGNAGYICVASGDLRGMRYRASDVQVSGRQNLNKTYSVFVTAEQSTGEKAVKSLFSPITATADGVLLIGAIPLVVMVIAIHAQ